MIAVLDRRTSVNQSFDRGDLVECCNCGRIMFVDIGTEKCPECEEKTLSWVDENGNAEWTEQELIDNDYLLCDTE